MTILKANKKQELAEKYAYLHDEYEELRESHRVNLRNLDIFKKYNSEKNRETAILNETIKTLIADKSRLIEAVKLLSELI